MPNPIKRTEWKVERKATWAGDWEVVDYLDPLRCNRLCAPEVSQATFQYNFGRVKREDQNQFLNFVWEEIRNKYLRIRVRWTDEGDWFTLFTGIAIDNETELNNPDIQAGEQQVKAYSLEHLLDRQYIRTAQTITNDETVVKEIQWVPTHNEKHPRGHNDIIKGNRTTNILAGPAVHHFHSTQNGVWTNLQIADYLIYYYGPPNISFFIGGETSILDSITEIHDFSQASLWDALNKLIDRRYGCGFYLVMPAEDDANQQVEIRVFSVSDVAVTYGGSTLPANTNQAAFSMPATFPGDHLVDTIPFMRTSKNEYDEIIIQAKRLKVCCTLSYADGTLEKDWTSDLELEYRTATGTNDSTANDIYREQEKFKPVYGHHRIPKEWDGIVLNGEGGYNAQPKCMDNGTVTPDAPDWLGNFWGNSPTPFLRTLPFTTTKDYTVSPAVERFPTDGDPEYLPPMAFIQVPIDDYDTYGGCTSGSATGIRWQHIEKIIDQNGYRHGAHVYVLDRYKGIKCEFRPRHYVAANPVDFGFSSQATETDPVLDYRTILATVMFETDQKPHIKLTGLSTTPAESTRRLYIDVPWAEYWYVVPKTVVGVDKHGCLQRYHDSLPRLIRDDKTKLETVAAYAKNWYGRERQTVRIPIKRLGNYAELGSIITSIDSVSFSETVRTPVTGLAFDFKSETTVIETGWNALDFVNEAFARRLGKPASKGGR